MRFQYFVAACFAASAGVAAAASPADAGEWGVESDGKMCLLYFEDERNVFELVTEKGGMARFKSFDVETGDLYQSLEVEVLFNGQLEGRHDAQTNFLGGKIGGGFIMKFDPQLLAATDRKETAEFRRDGKTIFRLPLEGSHAAAKNLLECQAEVNAGK